MPVIWSCSGCGEDYSSSHGIYVYCPDCRELVSEASEFLHANGFDYSMSDSLSDIPCPLCSFPPPLDSYVVDRVVKLRCRGCDSKFSINGIVDILQDMEGGEEQNKVRKAVFGE